MVAQRHIMLELEPQQFTIERQRLGLVVNKHARYDDFHALLLPLSAPLLAEAKGAKFAPKAPGPNDGAWSAIPIQFG